MSRPTPLKLPGGASRLAVLGMVLWLVVAPMAQGGTATSYATYDAYRRSVAGADLVGSNLLDPRLLSDAQFAGRLDAGKALLGMYYGNQGWQMRQVRDMESWQGKKFAVVHLYTNWCPTSTTDQLFDRQLVDIWNNHNVPLVSWEPFVCTAAQTPANIEVLAAQGRYDAYLTRWIQRLHSFLGGEDGVYETSDDRRIFVRLGHEMNGDWLPWSAAIGGNTPDDYVQMWRRVRTIAERQGLDSRHVQWLWSVNHTDNGPFRAEQYYPGDSYVDWIAISGYNWGETQSWSNWSTPEQVFGPMLVRLRALASKPLAISEVGSSSTTAGGVDIEAKSRWISGVHSYALEQDIRLLAWFNQDKETDWSVFGGMRGDSSYAGDGKPFVPVEVRRRQATRIVAAALLAVFVVAEALWIKRQRRGAALP